ncbi:hypothetical protein [Mycolicibacterium sp. P1-5]|uniref:hypothetical protein n=1 Tax=Mycolicibacterium sp. P1-5 TaxID=2024617 RepID=UPI0011EC8349|nr:hypothetical protein [Mycolicibacterium sp. P1-5]KAA0107649.1 hypothetical protein CIW47_17065 [Mycolicibacterium sp. P1-5]
MPSRKAVQAVVQVMAGLALNVFPAMFIAVYARVAPIENQGFLALSLAVGVYVAQLFNAFIVEGRLATPEADHNLCLPNWTAALTLVSGALLIIGPPVANSAVLMISSIGIMTGLLMSRSIGVVTGRWQTEALSAAILGVASVAALLLAHVHNSNCVRVLALGAMAAILIRYWPRTELQGLMLPSDVRRASWVTGETAVVGAVQPAITSIVLVLLGPAASVAFRVISTMSGALEPILAYGRYRLLAHGHKGEVAIVAVIFSAGLAGVLVIAFSGLGKLVFGSAWADVGAVALLLACVWKGFMLLSTVPFAALRKAGETALVFWIRATSTVIYLIIGVTAVLIWRSNTAIFLGFAIAEMATAVVYHVAAVRGAPEYEVRLRRAERR